MGRIESFRELTVWQKSHQLFLDIANDVELFPQKRVAWIIVDQILRLSSFISANISEGFGRRSSAHYIHFLVISRGSTTETGRSGEAGGQGEGPCYNAWQCIPCRGPGRGEC